MNVLRSRDNARYKHWRAIAQEAKIRRAQSVALLIGEHLIEAALQAKMPLREMIFAESFCQDEHLLRLAALANIPSVAITDAMFSTLCDTPSIAGIAGVMALPVAPPHLENAPVAHQRIVVLDAIQDAGNLGTLLRSAAAFGYSQAILGPGCADPWSPKSLRAGMGAQFVLAICTTTDLASCIQQLMIPTLAAVAHGGDRLDAISIPSAHAWVFGSEGQGISTNVLEATSQSVRIPTPGKTESLNVAAAAAICLYESSRQLKTNAGQD